MFGTELDLDILDDSVVEHHRTEKRRFRLDILGQRRPFGRLLNCNSDGIDHGPIIPLTGPHRNPA